jgi:hypothetical protein
VAKDSGKDYSLKEGEKISINIPGLKKGASDPKPLISTTGPVPTGGLKKLAPPPGAKKSTAPVGLGGFAAPVSQ